MSIPDFLNSYFKENRPPQIHGNYESDVFTQFIKLLNEKDLEDPDYAYFIELLANLKHWNYVMAFHDIVFRFLDKTVMSTIVTIFSDNDNLLTDVIDCFRVAIKESYVESEPEFDVESEWNVNLFSSSSALPQKIFCSTSITSGYKGSVDAHLTHLYRSQLNEILEVLDDDDDQEEY